MKRTIVCLILAVFALNTGAQNLTLAKLGEMTRSGRVDFDFKITGGDNPDVCGSISVQGNLYTMEISGNRIICDGKARYTIDNDSREVYIEKPDNVSALLTSSKFQKSVSGLKYGAGGDSVSGVFTNPDDKKKYNFSISKIVYSKKGEDKSAFAFSTSSLGKDWIITDLR